MKKSYLTVFLIFSVLSLFAQIKCDYGKDDPIFRVTTPTNLFIEKIDFINYDFAILDTDYGVSSPFFVEIKPIGEVDSIWLEYRSCTNTTEIVSLYDDGVNNDANFEDGIFSSSVDICLFRQVLSNESLVKVGCSGVYKKLFIFKNGEEYSVSVNHIANVVASSNLPIIDTVEVTNLNDSIVYTHNLINFIRPKEFDLDWRDYYISKSQLVDVIPTYDRDFIISVGLDNFTNTPQATASYGESDCNDNSPLGHIRLNGNLTFSILNHELNHAFLGNLNQLTGDDDFFNLHGIQPNSSFHWFFVERETSGFGLGCYNGVAHDFEIVNNSVELSSSSFDNSQYGHIFNDIELSAMGAINYDDISFPLKIASGDTMGCQFEDGTEEILLSSSDFYNYFEKRLTANNCLESKKPWNLKFIILSNNYIGDFQMRYLSFVIEKYFENFENATNGLGEGFITIKSDLPENTTSIAKEVIADSEIKIYPNPTSNLIHIDYPSPIKITIYNSRGEELKNNANSKRIDFSFYSQGLYLLEITDLKNQKKITKKIIHHP